MAQMPATISLREPSSRSMPISVPNSGTPDANEMVPSIGSITQRQPLVPDSSPCSSPSRASPAKRARIAARAIDSISRSAMVTGESSDLVSIARFADWKCFIATVPARSAISSISATRGSSSRSLSRSRV